MKGSRLFLRQVYPIWQHVALVHAQPLCRRTSSLPVPISVFCCPDKGFLLGANSPATTPGSAHVTTGKKKARSAPRGTPSTSWPPPGSPHPHTAAPAPCLLPAAPRTAQPRQVRASSKRPARGKTGAALLHSCPGIILLSAAVPRNFKMHSL